MYLVAIVETPQYKYKYKIIADKLDIDSQGTF